MPSFNIERFKRLPLHPAKVWVGGLFPMPRVPDDFPLDIPTSHMVIWMSGPEELPSEPSFITPGDDPLEMALNCLVDFALTNDMGRPGRVQTNDPEIARSLEAKLGGGGTAFVCLPELNDLAGELQSFIDELLALPEVPGAMEGRGVTLPHMRAYAEAAAAFYAAKPWTRLTGDDLIAIEHPKAPRGMGFCVVLGAGGDAFGLGFFPSPKRFEGMNSADDPEMYMRRYKNWSFTFGPLTSLPASDAALWRDHKLPAAGKKACPFAGCFSPRGDVTRPEAKQLAFIEGLLCVFASTTEERLDSGRWSITVPTCDGPKEYRLALPDLLNPPIDRGRVDLRGGLRTHDVRRSMERSLASLDRLMSEKHFGSVAEVNAYLNKHETNLFLPPTGPMTPLEEAQELMYDAWDARGRRRRKLAKQALAICPDCADAYVLLAEQSSNATEACELYRQGVQAGERALGSAAFKEDVGHFWGILETRPYMRARAGLAQCLWHLGHQEEAVKHYQELLRLNPADNQGNRYMLAPCLLQLGREKELTRLLDDYDDASAHWQYLRALAVYRHEGDTPLARKRLKQAIKNNEHVPDFLLARRTPPDDESDTCTFGGEDEAVNCASGIGDSWRTTPGALEWLERIESAGSKAKGV